MDEYTIDEVKETTETSPGVGLPPGKPIAEQVKEDKIEDGEGPWKEVDLGKRQKQSLEMDFMTDFTVTVQNTKFRCHKNILSFSSPKLTKLIRKNPQSLQLQNMDPNHFRFLLEIIYGGEAEKLYNAKDALKVARVVHELHVYAAVAYCTKILGKLMDQNSVLEITDFACLVNDGDLKKLCMKVIQEKTKEVLDSKAFLNCNNGTLKLILSQEFLQTTDLYLFLACARWAKKHKNPRQALGSALSLIRFRLLTSEEFIENVKPTQLWTDKEENIFLINFLTNNGKIPEGFSNENKKRNIFERNDLARKIGAEEEIRIICGNKGKWLTTGELNKGQPIRFSINGDVNVIGIKFFSVRDGDGKSPGEIYREDVVVKLKDKNETIIASASYCADVMWSTYNNVRFPSPVPIQANSVYNLYWKYNVTSGKYVVMTHAPRTYQTKTNLDIKVLNETWSPNLFLIIAPFV